MSNPGGSLGDCLRRIGRGVVCTGFRGFCSGFGAFRFAFLPFRFAAGRFRFGVKQCFRRVLEAGQDAGSASAGFHLDRFADDIREAQRNGFLGGQPRFIVEHSQKLSVLDRWSLTAVGCENPVSRLVHHVGGLA